MSDILNGREISTIEPYLAEIWKMCFRALDDIKESVSKAGLSTCKNLITMTVRCCDPNYVSLSQGEKVMSIVMPFFLEKGLLSMSEDVRKFSLNAVLKISKKSGVLMKPHLLEYTLVLLDGLTALEPQSMNYLSFHVDKYNITQDQLDDSRMTAAKMSPILESVEGMILLLDGELMAELIPKLNDLVRKSVGLPTKAGCARFIMKLCLDVPLIFKPHADSCLQVLSGLVGERSIPVRKSFANSAGYVTRLTTDGYKKFNKDQHQDSLTI